MAQLIKQKLAGATLVEVLISMVIIMIAFTITITLFGNIMNTSVSFKKIQVQNQLDLLGKQVQKNGHINEYQLQIDSINYDFLTDTSSLPGISKLTIKASRNGQLMGTIKCLYNIHED